MNKLALAALVLSTTSGCFNGCNKKKEAEAIEPPPMTPVAPETGFAKPVIGEDIAKRFDQCWDAWNQAAWDKFKDCYTPDASLVDLSSGAVAPGTGIEKGTDQIIAGNQKELKTGFPDMIGQNQLLLVHGHDLEAVTLISGTHTGPFAGVTAMNQKLGILMGQVMAVDDQGRATKEAAYFDSGTIMGQLAPAKDHPSRPPQDKLAMPKEVVVAKDDAAEQANVAAVKAMIDAFDKHDAKAMGRVLADDAVWSEQENPKDWTKAEALADAQSGWKSFSDMKMTADSIWGAGDYVVVQATMTGTNDAPAPEMGIKTATKKQVTLPFLEVDQLDGGKIKHAWVIANSMIVPIELGLAPMPAMPAGSAGSATK